ncbi:hypothetical protein AM588_10008552 [Phytophthora nicotianae]|nr:hypothetical protein AM588_10008552 [Phytophthora nicotianae]
MLVVAGSTEKNSANKLARSGTIVVLQPIHSPSETLSFLIPKCHFATIPFKPISVASTPSPPLTPRAPRRDRVAAPGGRGAGFDADELQSFLETLEEHLPLGRDEWELVLSIHNRSFSANNSTGDSLRRKFAALCRSRIRTGNSTCPAEVRTAKRVRFLMSQWADIGEGDDVSKTDIGFVAELSRNQPQQVPPITPAPTERPVAQSASGQPATAGLANAPEFIRAAGSGVPRPLVNPHRASTGSDDEDIMELMRMQLLQSQVDERAQREERRLRQEEECLRWEEERRQRDQDRLDERLRREEADSRHEQLM